MVTWLITAVAGVLALNPSQLYWFLGRFKLMTLHANADNLNYLTAVLYNDEVKSTLLVLVKSPHILFSRR